MSSDARGLIIFDGGQVGGCMDRPIAGAQLVVVVESSIPQAGQLALRIVKRT